MSFEYYEPTSLADAVALGARFGDDGRFLAGGTDLIVQMHRGKVRPRHLVSLHRVPGLAAIDVNGAVRVGALVTHRALERFPAFQGRLRALVEGAEVVGGHQVRNVGTVGGNIVNASPAADVVPVLLALDASVTCLGPGGERVLRLEDFLVGSGRTTRLPDELLTSVRFAGLAPRSATAFLKAGRRRAMEISVVCVAARLTLDANGERCLEARIALGAVAPRTLRAHEAERFLEHRALTAEALREAAKLAAGACQPISDVRASARYRGLLVETLVPRVLARCVERVRAEAS
jgi:aerobic carbon-monoxide dehydrogenase medium subunit